MTQNNINTASRVLQYLTASSASVVTCNTAIPYDDTIPQNTEGNEVLTLAITPSSASSTLLITFECQATASATSNQWSMALFQDTTADALAATSVRCTVSTSQCGLLRYVMTSGTTSSTTFKIRVGPSGGAATYVNGDNTGNRLMGGVSLATLTIVEYL